MKVLFVAAELTPLAKVGGLADVAGALPPALKKNGIDVRVIIPKYGIIDENKYPLKKAAEQITVPFSGKQENITLYQTLLPNSDVPVYLIEHEHYLGGGGVYFEQDASSGGTDREAERFTFFARASVAIFEALQWQPDIIHCQDWHAGMIPVICKVLAKKNPALSNIKTLLTIHNLEYQGWYQAATILDALGFSTDDYPTLKEQRHQQISSLQQAILSSDALNTVSPTYAQEILTPAYGAGLEGTLQKRKGDLVGILNGLDVERFNPQTDQDIAATYSSKNMQGKKQCKADLQKTFSLPVNERIPILGIVSRLADQKGIDLLYDITEQLAAENVQLVLLGTGDPKLEAMMQKAAQAHPKQISAKIEFNAKLAQQIYAGSDLFLMPSKFEPCGLGQMIAMRYGTVPVVRATGGLKDTVQNYEENSNQGDGFVFGPYKPAPFLEALLRALELYKNQEKWYTVVNQIMQKDFSWNASANKYADMYQKIIS